MLMLLRRMLFFPLRLLYGIYAWSIFLAAVLWSTIVAILVPGLLRRRRLIRFAARSVFILTFTPVEVRGKERIPDGHCIVTANHASYIDGILLQAFLPSRFSFVVKGEAQRMPVMHFLLRRIGARFVERHVTSGSARDARSLVKAASAGESLAIFPEGTFQSYPGLGPFRGGAFTAAIKGQLPVVPMLIRGARRALPGGTLLPFPARISIDFLPAIPTTEQSSSEALCATVRRNLLELLDEPDLAPEQTHRVPRRAAKLQKTATTE